MSDAPIVSHDPTTNITTYRASALGLCSTALVALRMGYEAMPPPKGMKERFEDGHLHEPQILARTRDEHGIRLYRLQPDRDQDEIVLPITNTIRVVGHIDALGDHPVHGPCVIDAKALSDSSYKSWLAGHWDTWPHYAWQMSAYAYALGKMREDIDFNSQPVGMPLPIVMAVKNKNNGQLDVWCDPEPPISLVAIKAKLIAVEKVAASGVLPECPKPEWMCPVYYLHASEERVEQPDNRAQLLAVIADEYDRCKNEEARFKKAKEDAGKKIKTALGNKPIKTEAGEFNITVYETSRGKLNKEKFAREHPDIDLDAYVEKGVGSLGVKVERKKDA